MATVKYYNTSTAQWEFLTVGVQGPTGIQGIQGTLAGSTDLEILIVMEAL